MTTKKDSEKNKAQLNQLFKAISTLENEDECRDFFKSLCTEQELNSFSQRFQVAKMLKENYIYADIIKETGASTVTVSRVKRTMSDDSNGFDIAFEKMK